MQTKLFGLSNFCGAVAAWLCLTPIAFADGPFATPSTPASTSAHQIYTLSLFLIWIAGGIFLLIGGLLAFAPFKVRAHRSDALSRLARVYRSTEIYLAWTVIPVLVLVLFLA
jgi:heme/copper-type cytochrome/quinol oxidase subunit 2